MVDYITEYSGFLSVIIAVVSLIATCLITYHVYSLSKRIGFKEKLNNRNDIKEKLKERLSLQNAGKTNWRVNLIDIDVYDQYPSNERVQSYIAAELVGVTVHSAHFVTRMYGVEVDCKQVRLALIGVVPLDWIVNIDLNGDGENSGALIYCRFKKRLARYDEAISRSPYKSYFLREPNLNYKEGEYPWQTRFTSNIYEFTPAPILLKIKTEMCHYWGKFKLYFKRKKQV